MKTYLVFSLLLLFTASCTSNSTQSKVNKQKEEICINSVVYYYVGNDASFTITPKFSKDGYIENCK